MKLFKLSTDWGQVPPPSADLMSGKLAQNIMGRWRTSAPQEVQLSLQHSLNAESRLIPNVNDESPLTVRDGAIGNDCH